MLVQTYSPDHPAIMAAQKHDFEGFAEYDLPLRQEFGYPPFAAMARIIIRGPSEVHTSEFASAMVERMQQQAASATEDEVRILGPAAAPLAKLQGRFRFHVLVTSPNRALLRDVVRVAQDMPTGNHVQFAIDIDPMSML